MEKLLHILIVGDDDGLRQEFEAALAGIPNRQIVTSYVKGLRQAEELARSRQPQLICLELDQRIPNLRAFVQDMYQLLPDTVVAAIYQPDQFGADESESAAIIEGVRSRIQDFLRRPLSSTDMRQLFDRLLVKRKPAPAKLGRIYSFVSNKGGVGKSTIAVNTACLLAQHRPDRVLLIDASFQLGVCSMMLDMIPPTTIVDAVREKERLDETLLRRLAVSHSSGLHLLAAPRDAMEATEIDEESVYRILNLARRAFHYVIVDTFPMLDSTVITTLDLSDMAYLVLQGTGPNVVGMAKLLPILENLGIQEDRLRLILNQNYRNFVGNLTPADIEQRLGRGLDYVFPYQKKHMVSLNAGSPYILSGPRFFGFGRMLAELVRDIEQMRIGKNGNMRSSGKPATDRNHPNTQEHV